MNSEIAYSCSSKSATHILKIFSHSFNLTCLSFPAIKFFFEETNLKKKYRVSFRCDETGLSHLKPGKFCRLPGP